MTQGTQYGTTNSEQCDGSLNGNSGCSVNANSTALYTYGTPFNNIGGGVYATEWTSNYIQTWFFPKGSVPSDITSGNPNPSGWGTPQSSFQGGSSCDIDTHFMNQVRAKQRKFSSLTAWGTPVSRTSAFPLKPFPAK